MNAMRQSRELDRLTRNVEALLEKFSEDRSPQIEALRSRVSNTIQRAKDVIVERTIGASGTFEAAVMSADDFVRAKPWIALGMTAAAAGIAGFLAGLLRASRQAAAT